jgi:hypothetical protein
MKERQHRLAKTIEIENKVGILFCMNLYSKAFELVSACSGSCRRIFLHLFSHNHRYLEDLKGIIDILLIASKAKTVSAN